MKERMIDEEIEKTLASIEGIAKVDVPPFLYAKVQARLAQRRKEASFPLMFLVTKPALSFAAMLVTVIMNVYMVSAVKTEKKLQSQERQVTMNAFAKEYGMINYSAYDK